MIVHDYSVRVQNDNSDKTELIRLSGLKMKEKLLSHSFITIITGDKVV